MDTDALPMSPEQMVTALQSGSIDPSNAGLAARTPRALRSASIICALTLILGTLIALGSELVFISASDGPRFVWLTAYLFQSQDALWLLAVAALLFCLALAPLPVSVPRPLMAALRRPRILITGLAVFALAVGFLGAHFVFQGYHLSRDEFLAEFDAVIFRSARFVAPIDPEWTHFASALAPRFMLPIQADAGFASGYLPVNAALRAIVGAFASPDLTSPLLAAIAVIAVFGVARRLWPQRLDAALISALLVATSSQVLVTGMTSYAMTAHLALNMVWLWLFLSDKRTGHAAAIATGFLATGLHQLVFHPLFAAPFIVGLWRSGRRRTALIYIASYAVICLFWIEYWKLVLTSQGISPAVSDMTGPAYFLVRVYFIFADFRWAGAELMLKNTLRFAAWQSPALLPLSLLAYAAIREGSGIARQLIAGFLLTLIAMFILLPYQGHGWGFRYLHGLIGSMALLCGYGWIALTNRASRQEIGVARTWVLACSAVALLILLPLHALQAHDFVAPYVRAWHAIERAPADVVIVDKSRLLFAEDLVRNDPFLRNRPKVLDLTKLTPADIDRLCREHSVAIFDYGQALALGIVANDRATESEDEARAKLRMALSQRHCGDWLVQPRL